MKNTRVARQATYFFGANRVAELLHTDLMRRFEREIPGFKFVPVVANLEDGSGWTGETGLVTQALEKRVRNASDCEGYLSGSPGMIDAAIKVLKGIGMPEGKIYYDRFVQT
jgi:Na+-transporting NADH:ubiquinone oxidoreductase subunit F